MFVLNNFSAEFLEVFANIGTGELPYQACTYIAAVKEK